MFSLLNLIPHFGQWKEWDSRIYFKKALSTFWLSFWSVFYTNRNAKKRYQTYELPNGVIKNTSKNLEEDPLSHPLTDASAGSTTELPLIEVDNVTGKSEYMNQARELMVQHKTTLSASLIVVYMEYSQYKSMQLN